MIIKACIKLESFTVVFPDGQPEYFGFAEDLVLGILLFHGLKQVQVISSHDGGLSSLVQMLEYGLQSCVYSNGNTSISAKKNQGPDNPTIQLLPIMSTTCCSGDGEGRKDKGDGGGCGDKVAYESWCVTKKDVVCVCDKVVCERWRV